MLKSKSKTALVLIFDRKKRATARVAPTMITFRRGDPRGRPFLILILNILTAFIRLGRVRPVGAGYPP
jgi:hypothetical protein